MLNLHPNLPLLALAAFATLAFAQDGNTPKTDETLQLEIRLNTAPGAVLSKDNRAITLKTGNFLLNPGGVDFEQRLDAAITPFKFKQEVVIEDPLDPGETVTEPITEAEENIIRTYSEQEVLGLVAQGLQQQITGTMIMGSRRILLRSNGKALRIGDTFTTRVSSEDPETYSIRITDIQTKSFSIALNNTEVTIPIGEPLGAGGITPGG